MKSTLRMTAVTAVALALAAGAAGCASDKATGGSGGAGADGVKQGPGVTDKTIKLGVATDLTGVYAPLGKSLTQSQQLYFEQTNAAGGVCGRKIETVVRDHGYDPQKAVSIYSELSTSVLAIPQFLGSPMVTAVKQRIESDKMFTIPSAWSTTLLGSEPIQVTGTTYDVDMINGIEWLLSKKLIKKGDKLGHVYFEGDYGGSALRGAKFAADKHGLTIVEQKIKATDNDMGPQVAALSKAKVAAILMSAGPRQSASLAGIARSQGMKQPILGSNSAFSPQLLATPAKPALVEGFFFTSAGAPISADLPEVKKLADAYAKKYPGQPMDSAVVSGYGNGAIVVSALKKACEAKDLTREGLIKAHRSDANADTGLGTPMNFTYFDKPATRKTYVLQPKDKIPGGAVIVQEATESELATTYQPPVGSY
ncbi:ABC-type branched-chain amino acid transport system, substrate-binding protein [Thermomonospora echinospora]|uniref:ABC-type branched-chain amino acid transport system, substrate-binding protein n=1 Tax=Thermomonospora echinospora TaxID=1992 RepID=A0A1H6BFN3_9ACTN|nr:ABC transporter substrate-binding protein [Thermomonospora echinospora]SEG59135.1 ABC-type branched-chain amino acid transport system, substrate-binding protein [Thermomonospora echinospora]